MKQAWVMLLVLVLVGCSPYVSGIYYRPHPGMAEIAATQPSQPPAVSAFATVVGIRKPDSKLNLPWAIEIRLRLDNHATQAITLDQKTMQITTGELDRFGPPLPGGPGVVAIEPNQSAVITAEFPFPGGKAFDQFDLSSLQLRWIVGIDQRQVQQSINFRFAYEEEYYWDYGPYFGTYGPYWDGGYYPYAYPVPVFRGGVYYRRR
jgi:hypothetical protein